MIVFMSSRLIFFRSMKKAQTRIDEFAFILIAGLVFIIILMVFWVPPTETPKVSPETIYLKGLNGSTISFELNVSGYNIPNVSLSASGEISNWITFSRTLFSVKGFEIVKGRVDIPSYALGTYSGVITVSSSAGEVKIPVKVEVVTSKEKILTSRQIEPFEPFTIKYSPNVEVLDSKRDFEVFATLTQRNTVSLVGRIPKEKLDTIEEAYVYLKISETNKQGNLVVTLNGEKIFDSKASGLIKIPINKTEEYLSVEISCKPSWMFWVKNYYKVEEAEIVVKYKSLSEKSFNFSLTQDEIKNFDHFEFSTLFKSYSTPIPKLIIKINGKIVYWEKPPLTLLNLNISKDISGASLYLDRENTITFEINEEGFFEFASASLTVYSRI